MTNTNYLLTGASGFLGKHLLQSLLASGKQVITIGRNQTNDICCDLAVEIPILHAGCDVVVHAAGKAHSVPNSEAEKKEFFEVNLNGTINLCKALELLPIKPSALLFISTVAVYGVEEGELIDEQHPLNGTTPYAASKIQAEAYLQDWCAVNKVLLSILRLPLIAGNQPPGNLGTMINGIKTGKYFNIKDGTAQKSIVMASDVANWIPEIAAIGGIYNLTDGINPSFAQLAAQIAKQLGKSEPKNLPGWVAQCMALVGNILGNKAPINTDKLKKITATLTFSDQKARKAFGWNPQSVLKTFTI